MRAHRKIDVAAAVSSSLHVVAVSKAVRQTSILGVPHERIIGGAARAEVVVPHVASGGESSNAASVVVALRVRSVRGLCAGGASWGENGRIGAESDSSFQIP